MTADTTIPAFRYTNQIAGRIEAKWQTEWEQTGAFWAANPEPPYLGPDGQTANGKSPYFVMDMFPYPSGAGLHVGHPLGYIATDLMARYHRQKGENVLYSLGFDAFGLPAELYAIQTGRHPRETTVENIEIILKQLKRLGLSHDERRRFATIDPDYVKWSQWIFLQIFNSYFDEDQQQARPISELIAKFKSGAIPVPATTSTTTNADTVSVSSNSTATTATNASTDSANSSPSISTTTTNTNADSASSDADTNYELTTDNRQLTTDKWDDLTKNEQARILNQYRLAYLSETPVNWAPGLGTVVANEEIAADGRTERGNMPVFQKPLKQWSMRITKYAQRLLDGLDTIDWPDKVKTMQRNWIGKSEGALVKFPLVDRDQVLEVYTTRDDTLFGATFMVIAPEHALAAQVPAAWPKNVPATWTQGFAKPADALWDYAQKASRKTAIERQAEMGDKSGVFTGLYALNPITGTKIPIFAADYVLMGYGTGAIMAVPGGDQRDFDFAKKFQLPVIYTVQPKDQPLDPTQAYVDDGVVINSQNADISLNGLSISQAKAKMHTYITEQGIGQPTTNYRLRDWLFSRQRYWGEPFPIVYEIETSTAPVAETNPASVATDQCVRLSSKTSTDDINSNTDTNPAEPITNSDSSTPAVTDIKAGLTGTAPTNAERFNTPIALPESMLPVTLPEVADYTPKTFDPNDSESMPETPLSRNQDWMYVTLDLGDGPKLYRRDANVMPNWAGSCWYYLRYADPHYSTLAENPASVSEFDSDQLVRPAEDQYWLGPNHNQYSGDSGGVDLYVGGVEHAVLHLLYARFWHMVLHDLGYVSAPEPFHKLFNQGYIQAYAYVDSRGSYVPASEVVEVEPGRFEYQGEPVTQEYGKIGKSLKNVVTQDQIIEEYGADTFRLYEMSMGPLDISRPWDTRAIVGSFRFLQRLWRNVIDEETGAVTVQNVTPTIETLKVLNKVIHDVIREMEAFRPNTAIARLIELNNHLTTLEIVPRSAVEDLLKMLAPIAPHIAEELWHKLGHTDTITLQAFPAADPAYLVSETVTCIVQINGKLRAKLEVDPDITAEQLEQLALADPKVQQFLAGTTPKKVIVKQPKVVSIVL